MLAPHALAHGLSDRERPIQVQFHNLSFMVKKAKPNESYECADDIKIILYSYIWKYTHTHTHTYYVCC